MTRRYVLDRDSGDIGQGHWLRALLLSAAVMACQAAMTTADAYAQGEEVEAGDCRLVQVEMMPTSDLQIVAWVEDSDGNYVDTAFITRLTGTYGMGNRPGIMEFNTGYRWPYGRRISTFPVWAHRHGMTWPLVVFQDGDERDLSHPMGHSSNEAFYCRPTRESDSIWDTQTCATSVYTDKGMLSESDVSRYPPRADFDYTSGVDHPSVADFSTMNPFEAVSQPTPLGDEPFRIDWQVPQGLSNGDYVVWVEVSKELDQNEFYSYPEPPGIPWSEYGEPYRGQPSVLYQIPITIADDRSYVTGTAEYVGYGDPDGFDGDIRPPDMTISTEVPGSGAARLLLRASGDDMYRVQVRVEPNVIDEELPGLVEGMELVDAAPNEVLISFVAPGDDDDLGTVAGYEVRYMAGTPITEDNFADATPARIQGRPVVAGEEQSLVITDLLPRLEYYVAIRAYDECRNYGGITIFRVETTDFSSGQVDACFVATAAYGSLMDRDVDMLRRFRDRFLRTHVTGELLVQTYYTFAPGLARFIAPSETARRAARAGLAPIIDMVRGLVPQH